MDVQGALVTGGASGLGRATVERLIARGARVAVLDLPGERLDAAVEQLGSSAIAVPVDVSDATHVATAMHAVSDSLDRLDVAVMCAGIARGTRTVDREGNPHPLDTFRQVIDVNLVGTFDVAARAAALMATNDPDEDGQRGVLVFTASVAAFDGQIGQAAYSASKGAIVGMTLPMARDLSAVGVRVCTIAPGIIETPIYGQLKPEVLESLSKMQLFPKRMGRPNEFAQLVDSIIDNAFLNGEVIRLDAGTRIPPK
jgi:3-hydroxyacyl-CoA dehydrogenase / 3-hydroxy-2-methylbutyryl-CoA dehydrogenase